MTVIDQYPLFPGPKLTTKNSLGAGSMPEDVTLLKSSSTLKQEDSKGLESQPVFLKQPSDSYVIKSNPATLHCRVAHALDIHFQCNSEIVHPSRREDHVEPETGLRYTEASVEISRDQVEEYFGEFHCTCVAISAEESVQSRHALVTFACEFYTGGGVRLLFLWATLSREWFRAQRTVSFQGKTEAFYNPEKLHTIMMDSRSKEVLGIWRRHKNVVGLLKLTFFFK